MSGALTPKQQRFVDEYLIDLNATQAAIRAGYASKHADVTGPRLLGHVQIRADINRRQAALRDRYAATAENIYREYGRLSFHNALDYVELAKTGDFTKIDQDMAAAITEFDFNEDGSLKKLKLADKRAPLSDLAKMLGMFNADQSGATHVTFNIIKPERPKQIAQKPE